ncbi:heme/hemin ABC transporter substrate-binding protein [Alloalcanivorax dieselolei]|uniref:heme/hemin ABC transporter substrate-binding protein n=1 Tax=Alloalcanivorax dieselolei TaxID=285091 RepID=UPI0005A1E777|nr:ABC transporter substrate-binding protein [Alloalcanivorax dieselolei]
MMRKVCLSLALCAACWVHAGAPPRDSATAPKRVVAAGGEITEIVYALEAGDRLVGVDTTSNYPAEVAALPKVGYVRALPVEGIMSLRPDVILLAGEAGPPQAVSQLQGLTQVESIDSRWSRAGLFARVDRIGEVLDHTDRAASLKQSLQHRFDQVDQRLPLAAPPRTLFLLSAGRRGTQVAGADTQAQALLDDLGLPNAAAGSGFKPVSAEALVALDPELIIVAETVPGSFHREDWPLLEQTRAARSGRVLVADAMLLLGFGPRMPQALNRVLDVVQGKGGGQ